MRSRSCHQLLHTSISLTILRTCAKLFCDSESGCGVRALPISKRRPARSVFGVADEVTLREITAETVRAICNLDVAPEQRGYVAPNAVSIAQAHFQPRAWFRAVYAAETPVGS